MTERRLPGERDLVLLPLADKQRPSIVLRLHEDSAVVLIYGTDTPREIPRVEVRPETREGKALGFYKPTYFYQSNVRVASTSVLVPTGKRCPPELFLCLRVLAERGVGR